MPPCRSCRDMQFSSKLWVRVGSLPPHQISQAVSSQQWITRPPLSAVVLQDGRAATGQRVQGGEPVFTNRPIVQGQFVSFRLGACKVVLWEAPFRFFREG